MSEARACGPNSGLDREFGHYPSLPYNLGIDPRPVFDRQPRGAGDPSMSLYGSPLSFIPGLVFIGMRYEGKNSSYVFEVIKSECKKLGMEAIRVDKVVGSGCILKDIKEAIEISEFTVFDLTNERPNVYYELGYAHGVGNHRDNVVLIARKKTKIHFDIKHFRVEIYRNGRELRSILRTRLSRRQ